MMLWFRLPCVLLLVWVSGCVTYRPLPLPTVETLLQRDPLASVQEPPEHPNLTSRPIKLDAPLTDLDAARLALIASPDLKATRTQVGVSEAQLFAAGLVADPQLSLSVDRPDVAGLVNALSAGLSFDFASLFTRADRVAGAQNNVVKVRLDVAWSEWLALNHVRTLVRRVNALERQVAVAVEAADAAAEIFTLTEGNMSRGDARLDDVTLYQIGYLDAQARLLALKRQLTATRQELNAIIGIPPYVVLTFSSNQNPRPLETLDPNTLVLFAAHDRLDIRALEAGYAAQERSVRVATKNTLPLPQLNFTRTRDTGSIWTRGAGLGTALPLWNRGRGEISITLATRTQLAAEYEARIFRVRADIVAQIEELRAINAEREALKRQLPKLAESARVISQATREGSVPLLTYETVRATLLGKQLSLLALEQAQVEGEVLLETSIGKLLWDTP